MFRKIGAHTDELQKFLDSYKKRQNEVVNDAVAFQEGRIQDVLTSIEDQLENLDSNEMSIASLEDTDGDVVPFM